ncbi:hypothetical protein [Halosimplex halophilum]|uniref:hypothetical protein n=1 Tax=Halosimplex halophilum TaxID=2559572 RepID=UPI00107EEC0D|nr:hypothetical protein [Halosimplex halophilum]
MSRVAEILSNAAALHPGDQAALVKWAKKVEQAEGKLKPGCDLGPDTTGVTVALDERVGDQADVEPGTFAEGWVATPALGDCPNCGEDAPLISIGNPDADIILTDCVDCRTRWDLDALAAAHGGDETDA